MMCERIISRRSSNTMINEPDDTSSLSSFEEMLMETMDLVSPTSKIGVCEDNRYTRQSVEQSQYDQILKLQQLVRKKDDDLRAEKQKCYIAEQALDIVTKNLENAEQEMDEIRITSNQPSMKELMDVGPPISGRIKSELQGMIHNENAKLCERVELILSQFIESQRDSENRLLNLISCSESAMEKMTKDHSDWISQLEIDTHQTIKQRNATQAPPKDAEPRSPDDIEQFWDASMETPTTISPEPGETTLVESIENCADRAAMSTRRVVEAPLLSFPIPTRADCIEKPTRQLQLLSRVDARPFEPVHYPDVCPDPASALRFSIDDKSRLSFRLKCPTEKREGYDASLPKSYSDVQSAVVSPSPLVATSDSNSFAMVPMVPVSIDMTGRVAPAVRHFPFDDLDVSEVPLKESSGQRTDACSKLPQDRRIQKLADSNKQQGDWSVSGSSPACSDVDIRVSQFGARVTPSQVFRSANFYTKFVVSSCPKMVRGIYKWSMIFSSGALFGLPQQSPLIHTPPASSSALRRLATINSKTAFGIVATKNISNFPDFRCPVVFFYEDGDVYADGSFHTSPISFQDGDHVALILDLTGSGTFTAAVNDSNRFVLASDLFTLLEDDEGFFPVVWLNRNKNAKFFDFERLDDG